MRHLPILLALLLLACSPGHDGRAKALAEIQQARVALDAGFAAHYAQQATDLIRAIKARGGTFEEWLAAAKEMNRAHAVVILLIKGLDAAIAKAVERIRAGEEGPVTRDAAEILSRLVQIADVMGVPVPLLARRYAGGVR